MTFDHQSTVVTRQRMDLEVDTIMLSSHLIPSCYHHTSRQGHHLPMCVCQKDGTRVQEREGERERERERDRGAEGKSRREQKAGRERRRGREGAGARERSQDNGVGNEQRPCGQRAETMSRAKRTHAAGKEE